MTDRTSRRGFLRSAGTATGAAAAVVGGAGAATGAAAQESGNESDTTTAPGGNDTTTAPGGNDTTTAPGGNDTTTETAPGGDDDTHGGQLVLTDSLLMVAGFVVIGILSPVVFAVFLARKYPSEPER